MRQILAVLDASTTRQVPEERDTFGMSKADIATCIQIGDADLLSTGLGLFQTSFHWAIKF